MSITGPWSTRFTLTYQADKLVIRGQVLSILWPIGASAGMAVLVSIAVFSQGTPGNPGPAMNERLLVSLLGSIWFSAAFFGVWLTNYFRLRRPFILDETGDQFLRGAKRLCAVSEIGWVEVCGLKDSDSRTFVSLCRAGSGKRIQSFAPIGDVESFANALATFLRVAVTTTEEW